jgi:hypothetical protein
MALSTLKPVEVVAPPGGLSPRLVGAVRDAAPNAQVRPCGAPGGKDIAKVRSGGQHSTPH